MYRRERFVFCRGILKPAFDSLVLALIRFELTGIDCMLTSAYLSIYSESLRTALGSLRSFFFFGRSEESGMFLGAE